MYQKRIEIVSSYALEGTVHYCLHVRFNCMKDSLSFKYIILYRRDLRG